MKFYPILALGALIATLALATGPAHAQPAPPSIYAKGVMVIGQDTGTNLPCLIGGPPTGSVTCVLPSGVTADGTFNDAAVGTVGATVPASAGLGGLNVGGNTQQWTGSNPTGSLFAGHFDLIAVNGHTALAGNGAAGTGALRFVMANDNTIPAGWPTAALQSTANASLATIVTNTTGAATAAKQDTLLAALGTPLQTGGNVVITGDTAAHITTSTTTTVAGAHTVKRIVVNSLGTVASTITVKDGTTVLAVIDSLSTTGRTGTYEYNIACATSIVVVTTGTIAPDVTLTYQ